MRGARAQGAQRILPRRDARADFRRRIEHVAGELVVVAVIASLHHDEVLPSGDRPAEANRERRGFAAGVLQAHLIDRGDVLAQELRQPPFELGRSGAEQTRAAAQRFDDGLIDGRKIMAEKMRRKGRVIIDVALAVDVPEIRATPLREADRRVDDPIGRADAARNVGAVARQKRQVRRYGEVAWLTGGVMRRQRYMIGDCRVYRLACMSHLDIAASDLRTPRRAPG